MKQTILTTALILIFSACSAQMKHYKKERHTGSYTTYSAIIIDGKEVKNPERLQAIRCMIQYLNNNWMESSNIYRAEHVHTSINYSTKKTFQKIFC